MSENIFEQAIRLKVRFEYKGLIGVEDLWDLSLEALDSIYKSLVKSVRQSKEEGLLHTKKREDEVLDLKIEVVKTVFVEKQKEAAERKSLVAKHQKKERLKEILEQKQNQDLLSLSTEDIKKLIDELG